MTIALLLACSGDGSTTRCGDDVLLGSECQDVSTEPWEQGPHELDGGFPTSGDTGLGATENFLRDPGFEEGLLTNPWDPTATPPGWMATGSPAWLRTGAGLEPGGAHGGDAVVALESGDALEQSVERLLTFDDRYVVRAWSRADVPTDAELAITFLDGSGASIADTVAPITAWPDWRVHSIGMQGPEELQRVAASIRGAAGAAWFDDIQLEVVSADPLTFDISASATSFEGFGVQVAPLGTSFLPETLEALGIRFVRVSIAGATDADLVATEAATGKAPWVLTTTDPVGDVDGFAAAWASRVQALVALGIPVEAIELLDDPSVVGEKTYAALVDATRAALDAAKLQDVAIAGPGTRTLVDQHEARDFLLALGIDAPLGAWSFQTGDDASLCGGGDACLAIGWEDVLGTFDALGGTAGHPLWVTRLDTTETTFFDATWPSASSSVEFNVTASAAYAVRVIENALLSIAAGAQRVYFGYAVDGPSIGSGIVSASGDDKPLFRALELLEPLAAGGATIVAPPDQTGRTLHVAVLTTDDEIVVVATNEDDGHQALDIVLEGVTGTETIRSARSFVRYLAGDPAKGEGDVVGVYDLSVEVANDDGKSSIEADLLPVSVTVLIFDRAP